jgi:hypothetical protein
VTTLENERGEGWHPGGQPSAGPLTYRLMTDYRIAAERADSR